MLQRTSIQTADCYISPLWSQRASLLSVFCYTRLFIDWNMYMYYVLNFAILMQT